MPPMCYWSMTMYPQSKPVRIMPHSRLLLYVMQWMWRMKIIHSLPQTVGFLAINDRLDDESVDQDAAFGSSSVHREAARFLEEDADEMHPMDNDDEPLSEPMQ